MTWANAGALVRNAAFSARMLDARDDGPEVLFTSCRSAHFGYASAALLLVHAVRPVLDTSEASEHDGGSRRR